MIKTKPLVTRRVASFFAAGLPVRLKNRIALELSVQSLLRSRNNACDIGALCELTHTWTGYGPYYSIQSLQHLSEQTAFFKSIAQRKIALGLEIGTCRGGTLLPLMAIAEPNAHIISVDLPCGIHGGGYEPCWEEFFLRGFRRPSQQLDMIRADSQLSETLESVKRLLGQRQLDYLFIDGDHRYEGVCRDFVLYSQLVRQGGIVAFHDIAEGLPVPTVDVPRLWRSIRTLARTIEFVRPEQSAPYYGIGVFPEWDASILSRARTFI